MKWIKNACMELLKYENDMRYYNENKSKCNKA